MTAPFENLTDEYDEWYDTNAEAYRAEQAALECAIPADVDRERAIEVGAGTGRFGAPLGIPVGVDPAGAALEVARDRGIEPIRAIAERLPVRADSVELAAYVTVLCFLENLEATVREAHRVLEADGTLLVGTLDPETPVGRVYQERKDENPFYAPATFHAVEDVCLAIENAGFEIDERYQTVFDPPADLEDEEVREGHGEGLFAVIGASPSGCSR